MIDRGTCEAAFHDAVRACDPGVLVTRAIEANPVHPPIIGLAVGKAALAMARGLHVARGLVITNADDGQGVPPRWRLLIGDHPLPGAASYAAGVAALALVESAGEDDTIVALISGGASALMECPRPGVTLDELRRHTTEAMARGATIHELNHLRTELSALKGGKLAARALAPVFTLVVSDVVGDDPRVIGSGPTVLEGERVEVIAPLAMFGERVQAALHQRGYEAKRRADPLAADTSEIADELSAATGPLVAYGEPTLRLPPSPGTGGRAQQLALELAKRLRGTRRTAFVAGTDGIDGSSHAAGAFIDGTTWDAIEAAGLLPQAALDRCDATPALAAVGALFVTGPTGINHADIVVIG